MMALVQRVTKARVVVAGGTVGEIGPGLLVFVCAEQGDLEAQVDRLLDRVLKLRIFADEAGRMNRSLQDVDGGLLVVSQFTLAAETKGNRPGFSTAAPPDEGRRLYETFSADISALGITVAKGVFGADMRVELANDGPVTIWLDTASGG